MDDYWLNMDDAQDFIGQFESYGEPALLFHHLKSILFEIKGEPNTIDRMIEIDEGLRVAVYLHFLSAVITHDKERLKHYPKKTIAAWRRELAKKDAPHLYELGRLAQLGQIVCMEEHSELVDVLVEEPGVLEVFQSEMDSYIDTLLNFQKTIKASGYAESVEDQSTYVPLVNKKMSFVELQKKVAHKSLEKVFESGFVKENYTKYEDEYDQWEWYEHPVFGEIAVYFGNPTEENENNELIICVSKRSFIPLLLSSEIGEVGVEDSCRQYYLCPYEEEGVSQVSYRMRRATLHSDYTLNEDLTLEALSEHKMYYAEAAYLFEWVVGKLEEEEKRANELDQSRADVSVVLSGSWKSVDEMKKAIEGACKKNKLTGFELVRGECEADSEVEWRTAKKLSVAADRVQIMLKVALVLKSLLEETGLETIEIKSSGQMFSAKHLRVLLKNLDSKSATSDKETLKILIGLFINRPLYGELNIDGSQRQPILYTSGMQLFGLCDVYLEIKRPEGCTVESKEDSVLIERALVESLVWSRNNKVVLADENDKKFEPFGRCHQQFQPFGYKRIG